MAKEGVPLTFEEKLSDARSERIGSAVGSVLFTAAGGGTAFSAGASEKVTHFENVDPKFLAVLSVTTLVGGIACAINATVEHYKIKELKSVKKTAIMPTIDPSMRLEQI